MAIIVDSDVLIDGLRGLPQAISFVEAYHSRIVVSAATVKELYQGVRDEAGARKLDALFSTFEVAPVTFDIARLGGQFSKQYRRPHGCSLLDCFIAATAQRHQLALMTCNLRHFPMLSNARAPYVK